MSEIVLVTQNDEPALAFGEYEISADGNTLYVGSAGVSDGSSEVIYKGISPAKIKYGVFSRLGVINGKINVLGYSNISLKTNVIQIGNTDRNISVNTPTLSLQGGFNKDAN